MQNISAEQKSIKLSNAGLVNNKDVCIKNFGSTFVCVCNNCLKEQREEIENLSVKII